MRSLKKKLLQEQMLFLTIDSKLQRISEVALAANIGNKKKHWGIWNCL